MVFIWVCLILLLPFQPWAAFAPRPESLEDLKAHYDSLRVALEAAENVPGPQGISQVRHYEHQLTEAAATLREKGVEVTSSDAENAPWSNNSLNYLEDATLLNVREDPLRDTSHHDKLQKELQTLDAELASFSHTFERTDVDHNKISGDMNRLLKRKNEIFQELSTLSQNPGLTALDAHDARHKTQERLVS